MGGLPFRARDNARRPRRCISLPGWASGLWEARTGGTPVAPSSSLGKTHIETVNLLRALVSHQERRVVGGESDPEFPRVEAARNFFQAEQAFHFAIGHIHAHQVVGLVR